MSSGRNNKLTGQLGEYLVCAELARRNLIATTFSGNVPTFDVLATDEFCRTVPIQVKSTNSDNWPTDVLKWMRIEFNAATGVQKFLGPVELANPDLIYVCVVIAKAKSDVRDRFFILTAADLQRAIIASHSSWMEQHNWKRPRKADSYDCHYKIPTIQEYENNWEIIQQRLNATPKTVRSSLVDSDETANSAVE